MTAAVDDVDRVEEALAALDRDGFAIVPGALDDREARRFGAAVDDVWRRHLEAGGSPDFLHLFAFHVAHPIFAELLDHPRVLPILATAMGWNLSVYHSHLDVNPPLPPDARPRYDWHRDGGRMLEDVRTAPPICLSLKVGFFLSDVSTREHGGMLMLPGSHAEADLLPPAPGSDPPEAVAVQGPPGTAVVFDNRLWHCRGYNRSGETRRALFLAYAPRWVRNRDEPELTAGYLDALTPLRRQLAGAGDAFSAHVPGADLPLKGWMERAGLTARAPRPLGPAEPAARADRR